jgi:hypothetical protein
MYPDIPTAATADAASEKTFMHVTFKHFQIKTQINDADYFTR